MRDTLKSYFRPQYLPHIWCPGCSNGIITRCLVEAIEKLGLDPDQVVIVSGIGCSSRATGYLNFHTVHTTHGRAIAFATGIKLARPEMKVIVITGDGDGAAIGGNHLIHAARRNVDLTVVLYNNSIYGMTGGQSSPLSPPGAKLTTSPWGHVEPQFDTAQLAISAGATFVGRQTVYHVRQLTELLAKGITHNGFSFIEAVSICPVHFGRQNKLGTPGEMLLKLKSLAVPVEKAATLSAEEKPSRIITGLLHQRIAGEFCHNVALIKEKAKLAVKRKNALPTSKAHLGDPELQKVYDEFLKTADDWQLPATTATGKKRNCWEIRLAGRGGQGIITAAILLAKAAIMKGNNAVQTHSYGPEMRGGYSRADVIIMEGTTDYPEVLDADLLVLMSPESLERYGQKIKRSATVIVDETILSPTKVKEFYAGLDRQPQRIMFRPITGRARELFGRDQGANLIAAGMLTALTDAATFEGLLVATSIQFSTTPSRTISQSLEAGYLLATAPD